MEVGTGGIGQLVTHEGYFIGEQAMFEVLSKGGYRYRMRATKEEMAAGVEVPPITQIGPLKPGLKRPEGYRGVAGVAAWDTDLPIKGGYAL